MTSQFCKMVSGGFSSRRIREASPFVGELIERVKDKGVKVAMRKKKAGMKEG